MQTIRKKEERIFMMKKKSKKLLLWLFVLTFVLTGIAGCGTKQKDNQEAVSTKTTGQFDLKTFEVKALPQEKVEGLRPGMSVILKK